jgi:hypothetical protein
VRAFNRHDVGVTSRRLWLRKSRRPLHEAWFGASCLPLALIDHRWHLDRTLLAPSTLFTMALDEAIDILKVLVPIAKAVPILGAPVEGSLEALSKILEFAQVRHGSAFRCRFLQSTHDAENQGYEEENGGPCQPGRSLAEDCIRRAEEARGQSRSF